MKKTPKPQNLWFLVTEIPQNTIYMLSLPISFFFKEWPKRGFGNKLKEFISYYKGDFSQMWCRRKEFDAAAEFITNKMLEKPDWALRCLGDVERWSDKFFIESDKLYAKTLSTLSNNDLIKAYRRVEKWYYLSHGAGAAISWQADADKERLTKAVSSMIANRIKERKLRLEPAKVFSILSTPTKASYASLEEKDFLKLSKKIIKDKQAKQIFLKTPLKSLRGSLQKKDLKIYKKLSSHYIKWRWLPYGYRGPAYPINYFLERWQLLIKQKSSPNKLYKKTVQAEFRLKQEQRSLLKKLFLSSYQKKLIRIAQRSVFIKEYRKGAQYHGTYCLEPFFREVAKRLGITLKDVWAMNAWEIPRFLNKGKAPLKELRARQREAVVYFKGKTHKTLADAAAHKFFERIPKEQVMTDKIEGLSGTCASPGRAKGVVKIIEVPADIPKMKNGDILVSETTYPSLVPAMKKASAIVTNAGGLTCHAAIVSRELKTPCVVGTKVANKVLKDGDIVDVDANKGVVVILKKLK